MITSTQTILGIDPGTATTGYGVIKKHKNKLKIVDYGCIKTDAGLAMPERLNQIAADINTLNKKFKPDSCSVEQIFFSKNTKTAISVAQARGVIIQTLYKNGLDVYEYTPLQIKIALTGYGQADKQQIQIMTKTILNLNKIPKPDDAADALAAAICHANSLVMCNL